MTKITQLCTLDADRLAPMVRDLAFTLYLLAAHTHGFLRSLLVWFVWFVWLFRSL